MDDEVRVEYRPLADLARWPRNPKAHDLPKLKDSLRRFGFVLPLVEDAATRQLVAGHGRLEALLQLQRDGEPPPKRIRLTKEGGWAVPVVSGVAFANEHEAEAYLLADNRLVEAGGWNYAMLGDMIAGFDNLDGTGWERGDIDKFVAELTTAEHQGKTPEERFEGFSNPQVKQLVLYFRSADYEPMLDRIHAAADSLNMDSDPAQLLIALLDRYEDQ